MALSFRRDGLRKRVRRGLERWLQREVQRARSRIHRLRVRRPAASLRELAHQLIDEKKGLARAAGSVSGLFGVLSLPADQLVVLPYLQLRLLTELATLYRVNLKSPHAQHELLELFWYTQGVPPVSRNLPRLLGSVGALWFARGALRPLAKSLPLAGAALSAYLNHQHLQVVGEEALRHYEGFGRVQQRSEAANGGYG